MLKIGVLLLCANKTEQIDRIMNKKQFLAATVFCLIAPAGCTQNRCLKS